VPEREPVGLGPHDPNGAVGGDGDVAQGFTDLGSVGELVERAGGEVVQPQVAVGGAGKHSLEEHQIATHAGGILSTSLAVGQEELAVVGAIEVLPPDVEVAAGVRGVEDLLAAGVGLDVVSGRVGELDGPPSRLT